MFDKFITKREDLSMRWRDVNEIAFFRSIFISLDMLCGYKWRKHTRK